MNLEILIPIGIALVLSLIANVFFIWYTRRILTKLLYVSGTLQDLRDMIGVFQKHLETLYAISFATCKGFGRTAKRL